MCSKDCNPIRLSANCDKIITTLLVIIIVKYIMMLLTPYIPELKTNPCF